MIEAGLKQKAFSFQQILYSKKKVNPLKNTQLIYHKVQFKSLLLPHQNTMNMLLFLYTYYTLLNFHS